MLAPMMVFLLFDYKVSEQSIRPHTLLTPVASSRVPKTILSFNNLLKVLKELTESYYTRGYSLYIKISQGKRCMEQSPEKFPVVLVLWSLECLHDSVCF